MSRLSDLENKLDKLEKLVTELNGEYIRNKYFRIDDLQEIDYGLLTTNFDKYVLILYKNNGLMYSTITLDVDDKIIKNNKSPYVDCFEYNNSHIKYYFEELKENCEDELFDKIINDNYGKENPLYDFIYKTNKSINGMPKCEENYQVLRLVNQFFKVYLNSNAKIN